MAGDGIPTFSIERNRGPYEAQEQEPVERETLRQRLTESSDIESRRRECAERQKMLEKRHRNSGIGPDIRKLGFRQRFYAAVRERDLNEVKELLKLDSSMLRTRFTAFEANALQVAVVAGQKEIFLELMKKVDDHGILKQKNTYGDTILTLAVAGGSIEIVKELVRTCVELVDIPNKNGDLPVTVAALLGKKKIVKFLLDLTLEMYKSNPSYGDVEEKGVVTTYSTQSSQREDDFKVLKVSMTTQVSEHDERNYSFKLVNEDKDQVKSAYRSPYHCFRLFKACMSSQIFDIAFDVFEQFPTCCITEMARENGETLNSLAMASIEHPKQNSFAARFRAWGLKKLGSSWMPWPRFVESLYENYYEKPKRAGFLLRRVCKQISISDDPEQIIVRGVLSRPILIAIEQDNTSFTEIIKEFCPDAFWLAVDDLSTRDMALSKDLFKIYISASKNPETGVLRSLQADRNGNTILHHAAMLSSAKRLSRFPSSALQIQSEIEWFKKMEKIAPMCKGIENKDNLMPMDLFKQEHIKLKKAGEKWFKETASSCSVVATLLITIMFSATFTVPGGYDVDTGSPVNLGSKYFTIFIISDALSLFSSCTSAMLFLRIYTLDFQDEDFLIKLPMTLAFGIFTLFLSIVTMVIAFSATFFLTLRETFACMTLPVLMLASIPVIIYSTSYLWIFIDVLRLTLNHLFNR